MKTLVLYAHPGQRHSTVNAAMAKAAQSVDGVSFVDLYARYPRHNIDIKHEQKQLLDHDVVVFQFPIMWYSTPSLLKEWQDLVLEYGFAYGEGGDSLKGKLWLNAVTAGAPESAYGPKGHNRHSLAAFLAPLKATARLCQMPYLAPYTLFSSLDHRNTKAMQAHVEGYKTLLDALCADNFDISEAQKPDLVFAKDIAAPSKGTSS